jgi:hypothetical protein
VRRSPRPVVTLSLRCSQSIGGAGCVVPYADPVGVVEANDPVPGGELASRDGSGRWPKQLGQSVDPEWKNTLWGVQKN